MTLITRILFWLIAIVVPPLVGLIVGVLVAGRSSSDSVEHTIGVALWFIIPVFSWVWIVWWARRRPGTS